MTDSLFYKALFIGTYIHPSCKGTELHSFLLNIVSLNIPFAIFGDWNAHARSFGLMENQLTNPLGRSIDSFITNSNACSPFCTPYPTFQSDPFNSLIDGALSSIPDATFPQGWKILHKSGHNAIAMEFDWKHKLNEFFQAPNSSKKITDWLFSPKPSQPILLHLRRPMNSSSVA